MVLLLQAAIFSAMSCQIALPKRLERICMLPQAVIDATPHLPYVQLTARQRGIVHNTLPACRVGSVMPNVTMLKLQSSMFTFLRNLESLLVAKKATLTPDFLPIFISLWDERCKCGMTAVCSFSLLRFFSGLSSRISFKKAPARLLIKPSGNPASFKLRFLRLGISKTT